MTTGTPRATIPATMRAIEIARPGGPEVLTLVERPVPAPGPGEVLVRVEAAGVNRPDIVQREGHYPPPAGASDLPGLEIAGTVAAVGEGAVWEAGTRVCALVSGGGYAEYAVAKDAHCLPVPAGLSAAEAASLPETAFTVWQNIFQLGAFRSGDVVLIHGGSSGIGVMGLQLVRAMGGTALVTVGSQAKQEACQALGAHRAINYRTEDFVDAVRTFTNGAGADIILDMVAGDYLLRDMQAAATEGRIVMIAALQGNQPPVDVFLIMRKRLVLTGSMLRSRTDAVKAALAGQVRTHVWPLIEQGAVRPVLSRVFPLAEAGDAHRLMESSSHVGKIVLTMEG